MGKVNAFDEIICETRHKRENMEIKEMFYINLHLTDRLDIEFTAL